MRHDISGNRPATKLPSAMPAARSIRAQASNKSSDSTAGRTAARIASMFMSGPGVGRSGCTKLWNVVAAMPSSSGGQIDTAE
jgi:hypothetical protein